MLDLPQIFLMKFDPYLGQIDVCRFHSNDMYSTDRILSRADNILGLQY